MPELAEVEFYRKRWHLAGAGQRVTKVRVHAGKKTFREAPAASIRRALTGATFTSSETAAKQMAFRFDSGAWLGVHLGMSGELTTAPLGTPAGKHDHLVLDLENVSLVFTDPRMFGGVRFAPGPDAPDWWTRIAPSLLSSAFTRAALTAFLQRRARAPLKAVLLMQERFPGIGNWMADEILWRAALHPAQPAGSLTAAEIKTLYREIRTVCRLALKNIAGAGDLLPHDLNVGIPDTWLFNHRWRNGGICPRTKVHLARAEIGGRTTCWSPARQLLRETTP
ncbi:Fpg/Nei family DNA glycosylase [Actomonas aquatica]|uniref:DNA-formamidopyrimidine glycosylase family protein n=1 Tax=Actomonas aquatica TaxID=2866162 RepID=A0ABZ1CAT9_9BACT|nr:DNA-formamidopyrimidine glycosylase family protein [Opitutus sp. WL0086]WRQ88812.1 DNA-formamidopyrimidine glycosylase family protein [Opitutus sp. WL0086]